jgi:hypothetical protein
MRRAVGIELDEGRRFFVYDEKDHETVQQSVMASHGRHRLWSVDFFGEEGDQNGRQHIGKVTAWARVFVYRDSAIVELDIGKPVRASKGTGSYSNAGQYVPDRRIYPHDARITHDQAGQFVAEFLATAELPTSIEWQIPSGTVAQAPFGRTLP